MEKGFSAWNYPTTCPSLDIKVGLSNQSFEGELDTVAIAVRRLYLTKSNLDA